MEEQKGPSAVCYPCEILHLASTGNELVKEFGKLEKPSGSPAPAQSRASYMWLHSWSLNVPGYSRIPHPLWAPSSVLELSWGKIFLILSWNFPCSNLLLFFLILPKHTPEKCLSFSKSSHQLADSTKVCLLAASSPGWANPAQLHVLCSRLQIFLVPPALPGSCPSPAPAQATLRGSLRLSLPPVGIPFWPKSIPKILQTKLIYSEFSHCHGDKLDENTV